MCVRGLRLRSLPSIYRQLDAMSYNKFNVMHWCVPPSGSRSGIRSPRRSMRVQFAVLPHPAISSFIA